MGPAGLRVSRMLALQTQWLIMASGDCLVTNCTYHICLTILFVANLMRKTNYVSRI